MIMKNGTYDVLKKVALLYLPALETLVLALGGIWDWPHTEAIGGTIAAFAVFLGACLGVSSANYYRAQEGTNAEPADRLHGDLAEPKQPEE